MNYILEAPVGGIFGDETQTEHRQLLLKKIKACRYLGNSLTLYSWNYWRSLSRYQIRQG